MVRAECPTRWSEAYPKPLVLLIDEIDSLARHTLISVRRQLRMRYDTRADGFPQDFHEHGDSSAGPLWHAETGSRPVPHAYLQPLVTSSGLVGREHAVDRGRAYLLIERCQGGGDSEVGDEEDSEHAAPGPAAESDPGLRSLAGIEVEPLDHYASVPAPAVRGNRS